MATKVIMPKAGMAMEEGSIVKWIKKEGDTVALGEPLLEIHTDKVNMEIEAPASGILLRILSKEGDVIPVTQTIGYIGQAGERIGDRMQEQEEATVKEEQLARFKGEAPVEKLKNVGRKIAATPLAKTLAKERGIYLGDLEGSGSHGEIKGRDMLLEKVIKATPLAQKMAEARDIHLDTVSGSGFRGKVTKEDILTLENQELKAEKKALEPVSKEISFNKKPLEGMRKIIAERMLKSHLQAPPVTLHTKADVTELAKLRKSCLDQLHVKLSYNDFIIKAAAMALREYPNINVSLVEDSIFYKEQINIGIAVALEDGLIVPVMQNPQDLSLREISHKAKELAKKGREGRLLPYDLEGATFTISNLGMYDILSFNPIINPPESAILGVCAIEEELKMIDTQIVIRKMMGLSLTIDHRLIDGAQGATFLKKIKNLLEAPLEIIL